MCPGGGVSQPAEQHPGLVVPWDMPRLSRQEIDTYIVQARERSYETMVHFGKRGLNLAATAAVRAATKVPVPGQGALPSLGSRKLLPQHEWGEGVRRGVFLQSPVGSWCFGAQAHPFCVPLPRHQSQGALAGRLRSFSMQDLRSIPDETPVHYQDPLYLEEQESRRQLLGELGEAEAQRWEARGGGGPC